MSDSRPVTCTSRSPQVQALFRLLNNSETTVRELAASIPINETTVWAWASARRMPRIDNLEAAFNFFNQTLTPRKLP